MNNLSTTRILRWIVSIPLTLLTALVALLWAWPKAGEGGALWLLSLPVGVGFVYLTHRLTAPPRTPRVIGVPIALAVGLGALNFGGLMLGAMVLPPDTPSDLALAAMGLTMTWWMFAVTALLIIAVLKLVDRIVRRAQEKSAEEKALSGQGAMPVPTGTTQAGGEVHLPATSRMSAPSPAPAPSSAPAPIPGRAALTEVSYLELSTLVEIAASLEEATNPTLMLLTFGAGGVEVAAGETELGTVEGRWSGNGSVRCLQSASALQEALSGLTPTPGSLTLQPPVDDEELEISADTGQRVAVEAVRA